ncbi:gamma carbonic anhydrase family protein [Candidatus Bathyarchaeota archaeon]|nr:gamma carbonic anhydrase family protein [Candidatus Bathyarchaeota archaeon]
MPIHEFKGKMPKIDSTVFVDDSATVVGDVIVGMGSSVWPNAVLRGDSGAIRIGKNVSLQDNVVIHSKTHGQVVIGDNVSVGHGAILHGCEIGSNVVVGMGAIVMDDAKIGDWVIIGAGAVVTENMLVSSKSLVLGIPGRVVDQLDEEKLRYIRENTEEYVELAKQYLKPSACRPETRFAPE